MIITPDDVEKMFSDAGAPVERSIIEKALREVKEGSPPNLQAHDTVSAKNVLFLMTAAWIRGYSAGIEEIRQELERLARKH